MFMISCLLTVGGFVTGLLGRAGWSTVISITMILCLAPFGAWAILSLVGALIATATPVLPEVVPQRPEITVLALSSAPLAALWGGGWLRTRRSHRRLHRIAEAGPRGIIEEIDKLANHPGLAGHDWLNTHWSPLTQTQKMIWVSRHRTSIRALHRESAGLGIARLGRRAADRLASMQGTGEGR